MRKLGILLAVIVFFTQVATSRAENVREIAALDLSNRISTATAAGVGTLAQQTTATPSVSLMKPDVQKSSTEAKMQNVEPQPSSMSGVATLKRQPGSVQNASMSAGMKANKCQEMTQSLDRVQGEQNRLAEQIATLTQKISQIMTTFQEKGLNTSNLESAVTKFQAAAISCTNATQDYKLFLQVAKDRMCVADATVQEAVRRAATARQTRSLECANMRSIFVQEVKPAIVELRDRVPSGPTPTPTQMLMPTPTQMLMPTPTLAPNRSL